MQGLGFVHDILDTKVLILFVMSRARYPATTQQIYELCLQDGSVSYFEVCNAIPQLVASGHLEKKEEDLFEITEKGKESSALTQDSIAYTVRCKAEDAVDRFNRMLQRSHFIKTQVTPLESGESTVKMALSDETGSLMTLELTAPTPRQAARLEKLLGKKAELIYNMTMAELLDEEDEEES